MATLSDLQSRLEAIKKARDSGVLIVQHDTERVQYRSLSEMQKIIDKIQAEIDALNGVGPRKPGYIRQDTKGY